LAEVKDSARIPNSQWATEGVPYIRASDLTNEDLSGVLFLRKEVFEYYKAQTGVPEQGDVLFNGGGEIGKAILKADNSPIYVQGGAVLYVKTSRSKELDGEYLAAFFQSSSAKKYIEIAQAGGTMKHFTLGPAREMSVLYPDYKEQEQIGRFFSNIESLITLHQREKINRSFWLESLFQECAYRCTIE